MVEYFLTLVVHLSISKNAHGIEYIPFNMAILYKCNFRLPTEQKGTVKQLGMTFCYLPHQKVLTLQN